MISDIHQPLVSARDFGNGALCCEENEFLELSRQIERNARPLSGARFRTAQAFTR